MKNLSTLNLILALCIFGAASSQASEVIESNDFSLLTLKANDLAAKYGKEHVLIGYDIDNTLLEMNQDLGSDQWFNWQTSLLPTADHALLPHAVANDFSGLLSVDDTLVSLTHTHAVDPRAPKIVTDLETQGFASIVITARGPGLRSATLRELNKNGFNFEKGSVGALRLDASFSEGVYMTSGQNKGLMLKKLLPQLGRTIQGILFIDDTLKNTQNMQKAFVGTAIDVVTIRYSFLDEKVKQFISSAKDRAIADWEALKTTLDAVFGH